jgi:hypothetical protein
MSSDPSPSARTRTIDFRRLESVSCPSARPAPSSRSQKTDERRPAAALHAAARTGGDLGHQREVLQLLQRRSHGACVLDASSHRLRLSGPAA